MKRYEALIDDVVKMVVEKYDGSLKAEHGTGRNMAPFVKYEWGDKAYSLMLRIKHLFDPNGLINPGVIFNDDQKCHLKHFKPLPVMRPEGELDEDEARLPTLLRARFHRQGRCRRRARRRRAGL